jgi:hypothetical protein
VAHRLVGAPSNPAAPPPASRVGEVRQAAESVECRNNLSQIRAAIQMRTTTDETFPASLNELGLPASMLVCPVSGQPYQYDPTTGQVRCRRLGTCTTESPIVVVPVVSPAQDTRRAAQQLVR